MLDATSTILVIDDDVDLRNSLGRLLRSVGLNAKLFASVSDFLKSAPTEGPSCLVLDVRLPGQSGLEFQRELAAAGRELPIIFITGHGDIPMSVQAMKSGAIEFLTKPVRDQALLDAIQSGLTRDRVRDQGDNQPKKDAQHLRNAQAHGCWSIDRGRGSSSIVHAPFAATKMPGFIHELVCFAL
jgi:FixJ family two-component response regulator